MSTTDRSDDARMRRETVRMSGDLRAEVQRLVDEDAHLLPRAAVEGYARAIPLAVE